MYEITNPVLRGFHPDPSILRVGDDYYIATSTFEWFPGVLIHHSRDLVHWHPIARPLCRVSQLDMRGNPSSGGVWAPCLSYSDGLFYLVYTDVKSFSGIFKDTHNYIVTATDITGEWSDPVHLNSSGFDPSLFHDEDGRKWMLNLVWDHRNGQNRFGGILLQEYSPVQKRLIGPVHTIFAGTALGLTEGPHLYRHDGMYFLITAEGGTSWEHAATVARATQITGPYEADPAGPILTSRYDRTLPLQKAGHASLVQTQTGEWYIAHLCARPLPNRDRCTLGRETALQKVIWTQDGWLRLAQGGNLPQITVTAPDLPACPWAQPLARDDFDSEMLDICFQTLRIPLGEDMLSLTERPGWLRLKGAESLSSLHRQSLIARRQQAFCYTADTCMAFTPENFQQMAGLICYYDTFNFHYLYLTRHETFGICLEVLVCDNGRFVYPLEQPLPLHDAAQILLRVTVRYDLLQFFYASAADESTWMPIAPPLDASILSDEQFHSIGAERFTGAFVGLCCQDLAGTSIHADFDWFSYREVEDVNPT